MSWGIKTTTITRKQRDDEERATPRVFFPRVRFIDSAKTRAARADVRFDLKFQAQICSFEKSRI
jgi:hypothetical protein